MFDRSSWCSPSARPSHVHDLDPHPPPRSLVASEQACILFISNPLYCSSGFRYLHPFDLCYQSSPCLVPHPSLTVYLKIVTRPSLFSLSASTRPRIGVYFASDLPRSPRLYSIFSVLPHVLPDRCTSRVMAFHTYIHVQSSFKSHTRNSLTFATLIPFKAHFIDTDQTTK